MGRVIGLVGNRFVLERPCFRFPPRVEDSTGHVLESVAETPWKSHGVQQSLEVAMALCGPRLLALGLLLGICFGSDFLGICG